MMFFQKPVQFLSETPDAKLFCHLEAHNGELAMLRPKETKEMSQIYLKSITNNIPSYPMKYRRKKGGHISTGAIYFTVWALSSASDPDSKGLPKKDHALPASRDI